jgi:capsular exopolysaccharide synthesis family protein
MTVQRQFPTEPVLERNGDTPVAEPGGMTLTDLLQILRVRRRLIIGTALAVIVLTLIVLFRITPLYQGKALVMLDQRQNKVTDVEAVLTGLPTDPASIENQVQILRSRTLLTRVVQKLSLDKDPEFAPGPPGLLATALAYANPLNWVGGETTIATTEEVEQARRNKIINALSSNMTVAALGRSTAIQIAFESADPLKSQRITNAIADAYVEDQLNAKFEATQKATSWLAERMQELSTQVQTAEAAVQEYKAQHGLTDGSGGSLTDQQLAQINGQLVNARAALAEQEAKYARVAQLQKSGQAESVSQVVASPLINQLRGQETELLRQEAEFSSKYGARHPRMLDLANQKRNIQQKIAEEAERVAGSVANEVAVARAQVNSLSGSLSRMTGTSNVENRARVRLKELEAAATSSRSLYEAFVSRFKEAQGQEGIQAPDARIISRADLPAGTSYPNKPLALAMAVPGGLILGFLLAILAERLDSGFRTIQQIERQLRLPVLATMPEIPGLKTDADAADYVIEKPMSAFAEAVRGLKMGLDLSNVDHPPKVILVTSSVPDEGKTTVSLSLARMAAKTGKKVVIVDGDLRRPSVANTLQLKDAKKGIVEVLSGEVALDLCLQKDPRSGALVLPAVASTVSAPDLLGSVAMERLIEALKMYYDLIIIDSAPLLPVHDTKLLVRIADTVLFAVRWERTPRDAVANAARALADAHATVAGIVLTRADATRYQYYSYGYQSYRGYNKYYSQ